MLIRMHAIRIIPMIIRNNDAPDRITNKKTKLKLIRKIMLLNKMYMKDYFYANYDSSDNNDCIIMIISTRIECCYNLELLLKFILALCLVSYD